MESPTLNDLTSHKWRVMGSSSQLTMALYPGKLAISYGEYESRTGIFQD